MHLLLQMYHHASGARNMKGGHYYLTREGYGCFSKCRLLIGPAKHLYI